MKAVLLAGGPEVTKCPLSLVRPRPLFPLVTGVLIERLLRALHETDVSEAVICANGKTRVMREHFLRRPPDLVSVEFSDDELPRGAAGCLKDVGGFLGSDTFLVVEAGTFIDGGLARLIEDHKKSGAAMTMAAVPARERQGGDGRTANGEPLSPLGAYVVEPSILEHIPANGFCDLKEQLVPKLRSKGLRVSVSRFHGRHRRVGCANSYAALVQELLGGAFGADEFGGMEEVASQVWKAKGAKVDPTAILVGPVVVGANAVVGAEAIVAGPTLIGDDAVIGEKAFVSASILWPTCDIGFGARVEQCIVTDAFHVKEMAWLSQSVAVDKALRVGDVRGLGMSGYSVRAQEAATAVLRKPHSFTMALSGLRRSLAAMRHDTSGGGLPGRQSTVVDARS